MSARAHPIQPLGHAPRRIAVGVDGRAGGDDAAALAGTLATLAAADLLLVNVSSELSMAILAAEAGTVREGALAALDETRARWAQDARVDAITAASIARGLEAVCRDERRDLLVIGSSVRARHGEVGISRRGRSLLHELSCPLAIAPAGLATRERRHPQRITVGFDGGEEAVRALALGAGLARASDGQLQVCGVIDDRLPIFARQAIGYPTMMDAWRGAMDEEQETLAHDIQERLAQLDVASAARMARGRPADILLELTERSDLLVIGSRRWGAPARVILGGTGEALAHGARCPLITVPRPR